MPALSPFAFAALALDGAVERTPRGGRQISGPSLTERLDRGQPDRGGEDG